jgi:hypothetical protein
MNNEAQTIEAPCQTIACPHCGTPVIIVVQPPRRAFPWRALWFCVTVICVGGLVYVPIHQAQKKREQDRNLADLMDTTPTFSQMAEAKREAVRETEKMDRWVAGISNDLWESEQRYKK